MGLVGGGVVWDPFEFAGPIDIASVYYSYYSNIFITDIIMRDVVQNDESYL